MIVGLDPVTTKHFARGLEITLCSNRKFIHNTMLKSSILTITKLVYSFQVLILIGVFLELLKGKTAKLTTFIFPLSQSQRMFKRFASVSIRKLWVVLESIMVFLTAL